MPITEVPVKTNSGFHGKRTNVITIVHLVVISYGPVYNNFIHSNEKNYRETIPHGCKIKPKNQNYTEELYSAQNPYTTFTLE